MRKENCDIFERKVVEGFRIAESPHHRSRHICRCNPIRMAASIYTLTIEAGSKTTKSPQRTTFPELRKGNNISGTFLPRANRIAR